MNCTITFNEQTTLFLNEFYSTLGQIAAGLVSTAVVLPMYNYYNALYKSKNKNE
jgi:hypothetical protein